MRDQRSIKNGRPGAMHPAAYFAQLNSGKPCAESVLKQVKPVGANCPAGRVGRRGNRPAGGEIDIRIDVARLQCHYVAIGKAVVRITVVPVTRGFVTVAPGRCNVVADICGIERSMQNRWGRLPRRLKILSAGDLMLDIFTDGQMKLPLLGLFCMFA